MANPRVYVEDGAKQYLNWAKVQYARLDATRQMAGLTRMTKYFVPEPGFRIDLVTDELNGWIRIFGGGAQPRSFIIWVGGGSSYFRWHDEEAGISKIADRLVTGVLPSVSRSSANARTVVGFVAGTPSGQAARIYRDGVQAGDVQQPANVPSGPTSFPFAISDDGRRVVLFWPVTVAGTPYLSDSVRPTFQVIDVVDPVSPDDPPTLSSTTYTPTWDPWSGTGAASFSYTPEWTFGISPSCDAVLIANLVIDGSDVYSPSTLLTRAYTARARLVNLSTFAETLVYEEAFTPYTTTGISANGSAPHLMAAFCADSVDSVRPTMLLMQVRSANGSTGGFTANVLQYVRSGGTRVTFKTPSTIGQFEYSTWLVSSGGISSIYRPTYETVTMSQAGEVGAAVRDLYNGFWSAYHLGKSSVTALWEDLSAGGVWAGGVTDDGNTAVYTRYGTPPVIALVEDSVTYTFSMPGEDTGLIVTPGRRAEDKLYRASIGSKHVHYTIDRTDDVPTGITKVESDDAFADADPPGIGGWTQAPRHYLQFFERNAAIDT